MVLKPLDGTVTVDVFGLPPGLGGRRRRGGRRSCMAGAVWVPARGRPVGKPRGGASVAPGAGPAAPPQRLACTSGVPLAGALVGAGFGYEAGRRVVQGEVVAAVLPLVRDIRRGGSAAVPTCARSRQCDTFYERGLTPGTPRQPSHGAAEAGAQVGGLHGRPASESMTSPPGPGLFARCATCSQAWIPSATRRRPPARDAWRSRRVAAGVAAATCTPPAAAASTARRVRQQLIHPCLALEH